MIDTHAHLDDSRYDGEREQILDSLPQRGLDYVINASYDYNSMLSAYDMATRYPHIYCTLGMHPHDSQDYNDTFANKLLELSTHHKVVGIGEIGLDYYYDNSDRKVQRDVFAQQIELADKVKLPICLHIRDAYGDAQDILTAQRQYLNSGVLWHCYSGSGQYAKQWVKQGHYFALGGAITFKNANKQEVVDNIPITQILTETDCPYMTPVPYRGQTNYPWHIDKVLEQLCVLYHCDRLTIEQQVATNAKALFGRIK